MLETSQGVAFLPSADLDRSEQFFRAVVGLQPVSRSSFACVYECGGASLRVTKVNELRPQPFTVFGWQVADLRSVVAGLRGRGAVFLRYEGVEQDADGIWAAPSGDLVAWFCDPDSNVLSVTEETTN